MTIFAGIFARRQDQSIPLELIDEVKSSISRHPDDKKNWQEFSDKRTYILKIDIGVLGEAGKFSDEVLTAFVAGDPILQNKVKLSSPIPRAESLQAIALDLTKGKYDALRSCRGTYCAVIYECSSQRLHLVTDKLGVRPLYVWVSQDYIIFSTALRILESLTFLKKAMNLQGIAEMACFGYPLSDRTPYEQIYSLHAGEVLSCDGNGYQRDRYWRWDDLPPSAILERGTDSALPERLYHVFMDAVRVRLREQKTVAAFLSGGLDSRAVVAALKSMEVNVHAANFGLPDSQDKVYGKLVADRLGAQYVHLEYYPLYVEDDLHSHVSINTWLSTPEFLSSHPSRPGVVWSGDGGSMGLGHIYNNADIVQAARTGDLRKATSVFMAYNRWGIQTRLLKQDIANHFNRSIDQGIESEIKSIHLADRGRIFYLFLLLNDQHRHMVNHFENLDLTRVEFEMPFYDSDFVSEVVRQPIDTFLYHNFYLEWLKCFPSHLGVLEVPWQVYPNHVPCPLPQPDDLIYQWDRNNTPAQVKEKRLSALQKARFLLSKSEFSKKYLNHFYFQLFILSMRLGKSDRSYLLHTPSVLYRYWGKTNFRNTEDPVSH